MEGCGVPYDLYGTPHSNPDVGSVLLAAARASTTEAMLVLARHLPTRFATRPLRRDCPLRFPG